jgi:hypothetical protein
LTTTNYKKALEHATLGGEFVRENGESIFHDRVIGCIAQMVQTSH